MKALSLTQPWASLIAAGAKKIETRPWTTTYRGPLAIHASKGFPGTAKRFCEARVVRRALGWPLHDELDELRFPKEFRKYVDSLPTGAVIATCNLVGYRKIVAEIYGFGGQMTEPPPPECYFGDYTPGRFGWILEDIKVLPEPIPAKGALSLWEWDPPSAPGIADQDRRIG